MKDKLTKFISIFLAVLMIFGTAITNLNITKIYAQGNVIKEITTNRDTIQHGESFNLEVKFGGQGTKVNNGQIETIDFTPNGVRLTLPDLPIQLEDNRTNESLGEVKFEGNRATITFNEKASQLEDVQGGFHFSVFAYYTGEITEEGRGTIDITSGSITKHIELINRKGGHSTNNVYSKKGVRNDKYPDGNRVDWSFTFNAAHKPIYGTDVVFDVSDELPDTMEWDVEEISKNPYVLEYNKHWFNLKEARDMQFNIDFSGQNNRNLRIYIPAYILYGASWVQPLNATEVTVRLTAKIKDEVMKDPTIKYVKNTSDPKFSGPDDWKLEPKDFSDEVEIIRQGGWATGTVPGELKIIKVLKDKNIPLHDIVFTLERKDGQEFEYKDGDQVKHEKRINLVTNAEGIANVKGLRQGEYVVKEIIAPDWIVLDASKPIVREFTVSDRDTKGTELKIENEKKTTQIKVSKRWVDSAGKDLNDYPNIEVQLYRNDEPINKVTLEKGKLEYTWDNLEIADDTGKLYEYKVKEVNEENQSIKIDERWYSVNYEKDVNKGFVITNKQVPPLTPLVPPTRDIKVTKDWKDTKGDKANAPVEKIKVQLFKDGVKEGKEKELTKENGWETTFEKLPVSEKVGSKNYEYTVKEVDDLGRMIENDGNISFNNKWYKVKITGSMKDGFVIENKEENLWTPMIPPTRDIKVTKDWKDTKGDKVNAPVEKVKVQLFKDGVKEGEAKEITSANDWKVTFEDLKVSEKVGSKPYEYTVKEVDDNGNIIEDGGEIKFDGNSYRVSITGTVKDGFIITNKAKPSKPITPLTPAKTSLKVEKEWKGIESKDAPEVTVYLVKNKVKTDKFIKLNKDNNWQGEFKDLDVVDNIKDAQANKYTVVEDGEKDGKVTIGDTEYKVTYVGGKVVNTKVTPQIPQHPLVPGKTSLKVEKEWKGIDPKEAPEVTIYLVKNGVKTNKFIKLNKDNKWKGEFKDLEVVDDIKADKGNVYTIVEEGETKGKITLDGKEYKVTYAGGKVVNTKIEEPKKPEPQKPGEPKKPETPGKKTPDSPKTNTPKNLPKTGDNSNIGMFVGLLALSGGLLTALGLYMRRRLENNK